VDNKTRLTLSFYYWRLVASGKSPNKAYETLNKTHDNIMDKTDHCLLGEDCQDCLLLSFFTRTRKANPEIDSFLMPCLDSKSPLAEFKAFDSTLPNAQDKIIANRVKNACYKRLKKLDSDWTPSKETPSKP